MDLKRVILGSTRIETGEDASSAQLSEEDGSWSVKILDLDDVTAANLALDEGSEYDAELYPRSGEAKAGMVRVGRVWDRSVRLEGVGRLQDAEELRPRAPFDAE